MKIATIFFAVAGLILGTAIVGYFGFGAVVNALSTIGCRGFLIICAYHLALTAALGVAWYVIVPLHRHVGAYLWGRLVRDSSAEVLPLSQIGGFIVGARAATLFGPTMTCALASTVVDVTIEAMAQLGYILLGLSFLAQLRPDASLIHPVAIGSALGLVGILGFVLLQRRGAGFVEGLSRRLTTAWLPNTAARAKPLQQALDDIYARRGGLATGFALHLAGWIASAVEAWLAIYLMGVELGLGAVITIESLLYAIRSAAFAVPNAAGVQEGAYVTLGTLFGLPPEMALALSLLKRGRDLAIGVPALLVWQGLEGGALFRRRSGARLPADSDASSTP